MLLEQTVEGRGEQLAERVVVRVGEIGDNEIEGIVTFLLASSGSVI